MQAEPISGREPSMFDVARLAGVSHQTVSRVLNEHPNVRDATRRKVQVAIAELGYRPNRAARALATGRYRTIGVVAARSTLYGPASLLAAVEERAADAGFTVSVARVRSFDTDVVRGALAQLLDQRVSAIVAIVPVLSAAEALDDIASDIPLVTIDGHVGGRVASVHVDQVGGARLAVTHLLDAGHATVWHVGGPEGWFDAAGRIDGWSQVLRERGLVPPPVVPGDWSAASGYQAGLLLGRMPEVTAIFAANDPMALGVLHAFWEAGVRVPSDVSLVGFDDEVGSAHYTPPLTTVRQDFEAVARNGLAVLLDQLDDGPAAAVDRIVAPTLAIRASVAPPRS